VALQPVADNPSKWRTSVLPSHFDLSDQDPATTSTPPESMTPMISLVVTRALA